MAFVNRFRQDLARALPMWLSEELVTPEQADKLSAYYRLDEVDSTHRSGFVSALLLFGALLVGLGVLSFVAANWASLSPATRAVGGLALLVAANRGGFHLWNQPAQRRWGGALLVLGAFLLGGNIVLMAQWFQVSGSPANLFLAWGLGCLVMGWSLGFGFLVAMAAALWIGAMAAEAPLPWLFPWVMAGVVLPIASWCGSRAAWLVGAVALGVALQFVLIPLGPVGWTIGALAVLLGIWGVAELASGARPWRSLLQRLGGHMTEDRAPVETVIGRPLVLLGTLAIFQVWAFGEIWRAAAEPQDLGVFDGIAYMSAACFIAVSLSVYVLAWRKAEEPLLHRALGGASVLLVALLAVGGTHAGYSLVTNALLLGLELLLAWRGLQRGERAWFWLGFGSLSLQVIARFFEFETGLLMRSLAFVVWGLALIGVGAWFERSIARPATPKPGQPPLAETGGT